MRVYDVANDDWGTELWSTRMGGGCVTGLERVLAVRKGLVTHKVIISSLPGNSKSYQVYVYIKIQK